MERDSLFIGDKELPLGEVEIDEGHAKTLIEAGLVKEVTPEPQKTKKAKK